MDLLDVNETIVEKFSQLKQIDLLPSTKSECCGTMAVKPVKLVLHMTKLPLACVSWSKFTSEVRFESVFTVWIKVLIERLLITEVILSGVCAGR